MKQRKFNYRQNVWREGYEENEHENEFFSDFINPKVKNRC